MDTKETLVRYYRWLRKYGNNDSHSGNASLRNGDDSFWITPTGACADTLSCDELVLCSLAGACAQGASLDAPLHQLIYQYNSATNAVLHSHGSYSVAMTMNGEDFEAIDFEGQYYFPTVPVITIPYANYVEQSPAAVAKKLMEYRIVIVRGHGVYAGAENLNLAYKWSCSLELSAKTAFIARQAGS